MINGRKKRIARSHRSLSGRTILFCGGPWDERSACHYGDEMQPPMHAPGGVYRYAKAAEHGVLVYRFDSSLARGVLQAAAGGPARDCRARSL
jgi:hypothetical protein